MAPIVLSRWIEGTMMALILAVGLMQGGAEARFSVTATVVRPACVVVTSAGEARWVKDRRPGPDTANCAWSSNPVMAAPRIATLRGVIAGREDRIMEINY
jgi:hypothetical protein